MEEKIYERQVTKVSVSHRVVDEKQIARHYTEVELKELYSLDQDKIYFTPSHPIKDKLLNNVLSDFGSLIGGYHEHDSLLQHKEQEELKEWEKSGALMTFSDSGEWDEFEYIFGLDHLEHIITLTGDTVFDFLKAERRVVAGMTPSKFNISNFKIALRNKYPGESEEIITDMIKQLMPRVKEIMMRTDFEDLLLDAALVFKKQELVDSFNSNIPSGCSRKVRQPNRNKPVPLRTWGNMGGRPFGDFPDFEDLTD